VNKKIWGEQKKLQGTAPECPPPRGYGPVFTWYKRLVTTISRPSWTISSS